MTCHLTEKQDSFCIAYLETGNASEAYRRAYNTENMKPQTINRNAKGLMDNNKIAARLAELREPVIEKAQYTFEQHLDVLKELRDQAAGNGRYSAAIQAEIARGKASGFYIDKKEITGKGGGPIERQSIHEITLEDLDQLTDEELLFCKQIGMKIKKPYSGG